MPPLRGWCVLATAVLAALLAPVRAGNRGSALALRLRCVLATAVLAGATQCVLVSRQLCSCVHAAGQR